MNASEEAPITIASLKTYHLVQLAGERLDQGDCEVYTWLLNRAYQRNVAGSADARIFFTREEAIVELGRSRGSRNFQLFDDSLLRLYRADVAFRLPNAEGRMRLISSIEKPHKTEAREYDYEILIAAKAGDFFRGNDFKLLANTERKKLDDYLSKWVHAFYSSHTAPFDITTAKIKQLADREGMQESKWRAALAMSLAKVQEVTKWPICRVIESGDAPAKVVVVKGARKIKRAPLKLSQEET
ncbi:hypothetical protein [uncultured Herbaspirillum sp.]|uniref:hypothetical protein n=1 Tax=uncultured Herbaspirillum sp. TaxID=160236 RepID=UPI00261CA115|nr:hypothetical protein [uncultured Herbaspirillum sp.]